MRAEISRPGDPGWIDLHLAVGRRRFLDAASRTVPRGYAGDDAGGKHVLAACGRSTATSRSAASAGGHKLALQGAELHPEGKFGGALLSKPGWPVADRPHC